ncbi:MULTISPECIES: hypothetical protein [Legionella]|uniref:Uncharacterized protein n=1 Tax=Legionella septentrionalis TaxID=2498109 RepID=A0A3S0WRA9_9GAMM|nr:MULTISPECIES: hypothetical protein [Legionella]MCP0913363.1 hypothetical protein [Legionella sp. 27cVA30]RUQ85085.1 hypothetical protein EKM59_07625 [Legionella septentrionalis]RUQ95172.1 hypothetical protein ELY11_09655 [Legionella septentrionalis]RUR08979.1 hypothetical protein ELY14_09990 [Legionella septentrionalis]RUR14876.1 hypothetical protein ELY10_07350 [Legionella septentrionalis]
MARLITFTFFSLFFLNAHAEDISPAQIDAQQDDQALCVQQRVTQCTAKCERAGDEDCLQLCKENAIHECRQAGE